MWYFRKILFPFQEGDPIFQEGVPHFKRVFKRVFPFQEGDPIISDFCSCTVIIIVGILDLKHPE